MPVPLDWAEIVWICFEADTGHGHVGAELVDRDDEQREEGPCCEGQLPLRSVSGLRARLPCPPLHRDVATRCSDCHLSELPIGWRARCRAPGVVGRHREDQ